MAGQIAGILLLLLVIAGLFRLSRSSKRLRVAVYLASLPCVGIVLAVLLDPPRLPLGLFVIPFLLISLGFVWTVLWVLRIDDENLEEVLRSLNRGIWPLTALARRSASALRRPRGRTE